METSIAIKANYWVPTDQPETFDELIVGIEEFKLELAHNYLSVIKGRPGGAGGSAAFIVEIIAGYTLCHFMSLAIDGIIYDSMKAGAKKFLLEPFNKAFKNLNDKNKSLIEISELKIEFQDSTVIVHNLYVASMIDHLRQILILLSENHNKLSSKRGEFPDVIHIPVLENPDRESVYRFRIVEEIDETIIPKGAEDYFKFWGLEYAINRSKRVYDVNREFLIDSEFCTLWEYFDEARRRKV